MNFLFNFIAEIILIVPPTRLVFDGSSKMHFWKNHAISFYIFLQIYFHFIGFEMIFYT